MHYLSRSVKDAGFILLRVEGMRCNHCKSNVEKALLAIEGVEKVEIDLASGTVSVEGKVSDETIRKTVETLGYKVL